ncbi:hypothetical protein QUA43_05420 [Microcoleus sp. N9_B4]
MPFLWGDSPILPDCVLVLGFGGAIALFFIRVHPCSSAFICGQKKGDRF